MGLQLSPEVVKGQADHDVMGQSRSGVLQNTVTIKQYNITYTYTQTNAYVHTQFIYYIHNSVNASHDARIIQSLTRVAT